MRACISKFSDFFKAIGIIKLYLHIKLFLRTIFVISLKFQTHADLVLEAQKAGLKIKASKTKAMSLKGSTNSVTSEVWWLKTEELAFSQLWYV